MKRIVILALLTLSSQVSLGQDAYENYTNFFAVEVAPVASSAGIGILPAFSVYRAGHKVDVGVHVKVFDAWNDGPGIIGGYLGYKFYPNRREHQFNLYFGYHGLVSLSDRAKKYSVIVDEASDTRKYPDKAILNEHMFGIGFDGQLGNNFYMFTDFNAGVVLKWYSYQEIDTEMEARSTGMVRIGLGFNVGRKRAK